MPLVSVYKLGELCRKDKFYAGISDIVSKNDYIRNLEAKKYLLLNAGHI